MGAYMYLYMCVHIYCIHKYIYVSTHIVCVCMCVCKLTNQEDCIRSQVRISPQVCILRPRA